MMIKVGVVQSLVCTLSLFKVIIHVCILCTMWAIPDINTHGQRHIHMERDRQTEKCYEVFLTLVQECCP